MESMNVLSVINESHWNWLEVENLPMMCSWYVMCIFSVTATCMSNPCVIAVKVNYYCSQYQPSPPTCNAAGVMSVGRATLQRKQSPLPSLHRQPTSQFAFTRPATALLERIAVAIGNNEPLLLVGETGTGKTSAVQYLAELMCKHRVLFASAVCH